MATCKVCDDPLVFEVDDEEAADGEPQTVPDDLELSCGCHFHWQCLLDQSSEIAISLKCPSCDSQIVANAAGPSVTNPFNPASSGTSVLARYASEGGVQENFDILPAITEEAYLEANPEARPARAYHVMCAEGDVEGIVELLKAAERGDGEEPRMSLPQLIRYQDPLANNKSALHVAVEKSQDEAAWLLLWIASPLRTGNFPGPAMQAAQAMGLNRPETPLSEDIRALQDSQGRTAEAVAAEMDGVWSILVQAGALTPGST
ncbi:hypothetical protein F4780DRAFT_594032 [Xylariomycetidae sp. FL0641]|nr:hypothetical protein F4780DRAFT_594032 [Xylariomycetidae sp. FL0641]